MWVRWVRVGNIFEGVVLVSLFVGVRKPLSFYQDMCVSVYSIFSVERMSQRGTPHYIGLRGYSTGGRYADAIGLGG